MSDILERLDKLKAQMQDEDFQKGNGLSNEVNIHIFCYDPKDEMAVRYFTEQLVSDQDMNCHVIEKNLYKILLKLCEEKRLLDKIPKLEETKGSKFILENVRGRSASAKNFVDEICKDGFKEGDVLLITGVGEAYPFIRSHEILNTIQPRELNSIPIVVLYPGSFDGRDVYLFNKLPKQDYYRAFKAIVEDKR